MRGIKVGRGWTAGRSAQLIGWLLAYAIVALIAAAARRRKTGCGLFLLLLALGGALCWSRCAAGDLRVATFNIRNFRPEKTDVARLVTLLEELDADVIAVQEIEDPAGFKDVVGRIRAPGRRYALALSRCGGRSAMHVGFVYDAARIELRGQQEYPELDPGGGGDCRGERSGLLGQFAESEVPFELLVVHLVATGDEERAARRRAQWDLALAIVARRRGEGAGAIAILGDTNSTGYMDDRWGERTFITRRLRETGLELPTSQLGCSAYWRPEPDTLAPSLLDHVVVTPGFPASGAAEVRGFCAEVACRGLPGDSPPPDYMKVSDHCPVVLGR